MGKKCCKSEPPCKGCPKLKKRHRKHGKCDGACLVSPAPLTFWPISPGDTDA